MVNICICTSGTTLKFILKHMQKKEKLTPVSRLYRDFPTSRAHHPSSSLHNSVGPMNSLNNQISARSVRRGATGCAGFYQRAESPCATTGTQKLETRNAQLFGPEKKRPGIEFQVGVSLSRRRMLLAFLTFNRTRLTLSFKL